MNAEIITIGDEILLGQIVDTNSAWIGQQFDAANIKVNYISSISDKRESILNALKQAHLRSNIVIVTGGLGPTKDDVTKDTIAEYFKSKLVRDENVLIHVKNIFSKYGKDTEMPLVNYAQADVLEIADVLFNDVGTAPGMWIDLEGVIYVFLPGVPFEMQYLITNRVLPKLEAYLSKTEAVYHEHILTVGIGESFLAEQISDIEEELPEFIKLAYLPKFGLVRLRLTAVGSSEKVIESTKIYADRIADRLKNNVFARRDISLEEAIVHTFAQRNLKLSTAESCTGGGVAAAITSIPGSSQIFDCGIVAYHNSIKNDILGVSNDTLTNYGAVSEQTVIEMANGVKRLSNSNYAIATSGIAGPGGGSDEKPVGTVWVAIVGLKKTITKKFHFKNNRAVNIERTISQALIMLWNLYKEENDCL